MYVVSFGAHEQRGNSLELISMETFNRLGLIGWRMHHAFEAHETAAGEARGFDIFVPLPGDLTI